MMLKYLLIFLIVVRLTFSQNCQLNSTIFDKKWIFALRPTPTTWDVLHTDFLLDQQKLYMICNAATSTIERQCNRGFLTPLPPDASCSRRIKATVQAIQNKASCRLKNGELFDIQYNLPDGFKISLYQVCYSKINEAPIYAHHLAYGFKLAATSYQRPQFSVTPGFSSARRDSFEMRNIYHTFERLLGSQQTFVPTNKSLVLDRGHLANSQDFLTFDQMDETFKYLNVMPQFSSINRSNWKRLENWIHNLPQSTKYAEVVTGTFGILELPHTQTQAMVPMYLMVNNTNPIPMYLYKIVKYEGSCYSFITLNNPFNAVAAINNDICRPVACPPNLVFSNEKSGGLTYCCDYTHFYRKIGRHAALC